MKIFSKNLIILLSIAFIFNACNREEIDTEKPVIDLSPSNVFPKNCDTLYFGETFTFKGFFSDNAELGSYSIDIHNNFDHHSHSTEINDCDLGDKKEPVNPFVFIQDYEIPSGQLEFEANDLINIPNGDGINLYDEGDYHFSISLTDNEGWSTFKGLSIKILRR